MPYVRLSWRNIVAMAKIYVADIKNDVENLVAWMTEFERETGLKITPSLDAGGYFIEVPDDAGPDSQVFAKLRFS